MYKLGRGKRTLALCKEWLFNCLRSSLHSSRYRNFLMLLLVGVVVFYWFLLIAHPVGLLYSTLVRVNSHTNLRIEVFLCYLGSVSVYYNQSVCYNFHFHDSYLQLQHWIVKLTWKFGFFFIHQDAKEKNIIFVCLPKERKLLKFYLFKVNKIKGFSRHVTEVLNVGQWNCSNIHLRICLTERVRPRL